MLPQQQSLLVRAFSPWLDEEDETVVAYLCEMLEEGQTNEDAVEMMQLHCSLLTEQPSEVVLSKLMEYRAKLAAPTCLVQSTAPPIVVHEDKEPEFATPAVVAVEEEEDLDRENELAFLRALAEFCGVDESEYDTLMYLCRRIVLSSDVEECARWVLDHGWNALKQRKLEHDMHKNKLAEDQVKREQLARNRLLNRFDEQECDSIKARAHSSVSGNQKLKDDSSKPNSKLRFLDGKIVATNGAKYIEIQDKEEWDGGSRGRIKTKGKRGPGYKPG